jgi:acetylornithine deacetylase/succinyl-diaminopimelate desuccinylase-like protein
VECRGDTSTVAERGELSIHVHTTSLVASSQVDPVTTAVAEAAEPLEVSVATVLSRRPVQLRESHRLAEQALAAVSSVTGEPATAGAAPHWTVAALHALAGTPAVVYGPSVEAGSNEPGWVSTDAIRQGAAVLAALATTFCAPR